MNVLFVSQCNKRALTETRRILDQFAERRGERTWQTSITQDGLDVVRRLLRKSARKNTAVACHWIRGKDHSELIWVVGDSSQFNDEGAVPTNTTERDILRAEDESNWHHLPLMSALTALAALLHDLGKSTQAFQERLRAPMVRERNHYRHEWVSVRLWQAFVGSDNDQGWLQRLSACADEAEDGNAFVEQWLDYQNGRLIRDGIDTHANDDTPNSPHNPFRALPPLAQAVAWLVLTHHRLPCVPNRTEAAQQADDLDENSKKYKRFGSRTNIQRSMLQGLLQRINADWNEPREEDISKKQIEAYWNFPNGLPVSNSVWRKQAARYANKLLPFAMQAHPLALLHDPFAMHVSRLCLMLADHHYSRFGLNEENKPVVQRQPYLQAQAKLAANTTKNSSGRVVLNQTLDEHLLGVQAHTTLITHSLPSLARSLPALKNHRGLKKRSSNTRFQWQDKAADLAASVRQRTANQGAFIVNMASTGCGKTLANARVMYALADPSRGLRCAFAIGLRTLTLQTGRSFQRDLGLSDEQLAIKVGGAASRALFEYGEQLAEASGSASSQGLLDEGGQVLFEGNDRHPLLERMSDDPQVRSLIAAPLLVCTVDHLTPATESLRGGRQIAPMLRLMTGDLVLDEPDDFDMADLPAITRLVHWAGLLGSRVLLSSATLPPALVDGLFRAYRAGREVYQKHRSERPNEPVSICCMWLDEFNQYQSDCAKASEFTKAHQEFVDKRMAKLAKESSSTPRRLAQISQFPDSLRAPALNETQRIQLFAGYLLQRAWSLHLQAQNHSVDPVSGKRVSFGLIRMANIAPLFEVALAIYAQGAPQGARIHLCVYHSQYPLLVRSAIERELDTVLNRRRKEGEPEPAIQRPSIRSLLEASPEKDQLFIVLGSPVTEVGRDHDYDWAVVEPSSMRSLIQLAGRVRRHRTEAVNAVNIEVLDCNWKALGFTGNQGQRNAAYCQPGFELDEADSKRFHFETHSLTKLLSRQLQEWGSPWPIDAQPRISQNKRKPKEGCGAQNWVDLEHDRMREAMLPKKIDAAQSTPVKRDASLAWWYESPEPTLPPHTLWLTGVLPQCQRFRDDTLPREDVVWLPDEEEETLTLHRVDDGSQRSEKCYVRIDEQCQHIPDKKLQPGPNHSVQPWVHVNVFDELRALAEVQGLTLEKIAKKFATVSLPDVPQGWWWHEVLGFNKVS